MGMAWQGNPTIPGSGSEEGRASKRSLLSLSLCLNSSSSSSSWTSVFGGAAVCATSEEEEEEVVVRRRRLGLPLFM